MHQESKARGSLQLRPIALLLATWAIVVIYAYPGYLNWDAGDQLHQARTAVFEDWHPPVMAAYWRVMDKIVRGPVLMLFLQTALFVWGAYRILGERLTPLRAAAATAALTLFPPILTPLAPVWKDAQMAALFLSGTALAVHTSRPARVFGWVLLLVGTAVRDNAIAAVPLLLFFIVPRLGVRRPILVVAAVISLTVALFGAAGLLNSMLTAKPVHPWYKTVAIHDLAGTLCLEPPLTDEQIRAELTGVPLLVQENIQANMCKQYDPRAWFALSFGSNNIFNQQPDEAERAARRAAWTRIVTQRTGSWLLHRWQLARELLGLTPNQPWEPVCQTINANLEFKDRVSHQALLSWAQKRMGNAFVSLSRTPLYRPWVYAAIAICLLAISIWSRDRLVMALAGSGLCYECSFFVGAAAPDFRYSHWLVTVTCIAVILAFVARYRAGRAKP